VEFAHLERRQGSLEGELLGGQQVHNDYEPSSLRLQTDISLVDSVVALQSVLGQFPPELYENM
jgi:hypothetical protein